ncbi:MAG: RsmG family class I SAM-dependent methyltransferase [Acidimicrobiales bacterium]
MTAESALVRQLRRARSLGFLGPADVEDHIEHAAGFLWALGPVVGCVIDLGSGGGVPGLVVAAARPDLEMVLVDAMAKRCSFLEAALADLDFPHARVVCGRAEVIGRSELRGAADAVLARGFGRPAVTAECAAPLLRVGGRLVVSEPPDRVPRWPIEPLARLGLRPEERTPDDPAIQVLTQVDPCPDDVPRRDGMPAKRPLF